MDIYNIVQELNNTSIIGEQRALIRKLKNIDLKEVKSKIFDSNEVNNAVTKQQEARDDWFHVVNMKRQIESYELSNSVVPSYYCEVLISVLSCYYD